MKSRFTLLAITVSLTTALAGCSSDKEAPAASTKPADPYQVMVQPDFLKRLKISPAGEGNAIETLRVPARITADERLIARIGAAVTGRVTQIHAVLGQKVKAGEVLATLHSTELSSAQLAYLKARSQENLQRRAVERAKQLFAADVISAAELQRRESELAQAQAELQASLDQLTVLGMTSATINKLSANGKVHSLSDVTSTLNGQVIERKVTQGQVVQPADALYTVADLSHVWVVAEVPEQQADLVTVGEETEAEIAALNGRRIAGQLIYVGNTVNPATRTVTVRMDVTNPDGSIKPEMLATMLIKSKPRRQLVVPAPAVVRDDNQDYVFVQTAAQQFYLRKVKLGEENNGIIPVLEGLKAGEKIVTDGAFHLNNERRRKELE